MINLSVRISKKRVTVSIALATIAIFAIFLGVKQLKGDFDNVAISETSAKVSDKSFEVKTNEDRLKFIQSFGWKIDKEPSEILDVIIPEDFGDVYKRYNEIQKEQGFDLKKYSNKKVKRYSYNLVNYPEKVENMRVNLLVYKDKVIGGDVCSIELDGFMHGLQLPKD